MAQTTISLTPGQSVVLPAGAQIDSWTATGDASLTSTCNNLPTQDELCCIAFRFADSEGLGADGALQTLTFVSLEIGGTVYDMGDMNLDANGSPTDVAQAINLITFPAFYVYGVVVDVLEERSEWAISARVACSMVDSIKFRLTGTGFGELLVIPTPIVDCTCALPTSNDSTATHCDVIT